MGAGYHPSHHVAIDRWTGGAASGLLYSVLEPHGLEWEDIRIRVDLDRLGSAHADFVAPALALLWLVVRDLVDGAIKLGYGTNRGMGDVRIRADDITWTGFPGPEATRPGVGATRPIRHDEVDIGAIEAAWKDWLSDERNASLR